MVLRGYKYRIYPTDVQKIQLAKTFGCVRFVYNNCLNKKIDEYNKNKKNMSNFDCNNYVNRELKLKFDWLKEVDKFALTNAVYDMGNAYQKFYREKTGYPKFKSKRTNKYSYTTNFTNNNISVNFDEHFIKLPKLKQVKAVVHRKFDGKIKNATISKEPNGQYYVSILVEEEIKKLPKNNNKIGIDLGIKEFLVASDGNVIHNPKTLYKYQNKLAKLQRELSSKEKGSSNWNKCRIKVARLHKKISNIRNDFLHKLSSKIIHENQVVISEDLNIKNMVKNKNLSKAISDVSWSEFMRQIDYKSKWYGRTYHKTNKFFPSSQMCNCCGFQNKEVKNLNIREWTCDNCQTVHERDVNASINILKKGIEDLQLA